MFDHPEIGFLVIEVKGGRVSRRVADGVWISQDRSGRDHIISDPFEQAMRSKKVILAALQKRWKGRAPFIWARHGVILPHSFPPKDFAALGASIPPDIAAFADDMARLPAKLLQMIAFAPPGAVEKPGGLGARGVELLEDFYGKDFDLSPAVKDLVLQADLEIDRLTEAQNRYLDFLGETATALIEGGAGTGKTTIAMERARRAADAGRRVLFLCFNRPLSKFVSAEISAPAVSVATFHSFCGRMCHAAGLDADVARQREGESRFWNRVLPELLEEIGLDDPPEVYDDVIIDEGQDFRAQWIDALRLFLDENGKMVVFRDDFQNIYGGEELAATLGVMPMRLNENVRNTKCIFEVGDRFREGPRQICLGPEGAPVRWVETTLERHEKDVLKEVNRLLVNDRIRSGELAVLYCSGADAKESDGAARFGRHACVDALSVRADAICIDTVHRFKGLDRPVVVLADMEQCNRELAYVALTRAKSLCVVIATKPVLEFLQTGADVTAAGCSPISSNDAANSKNAD